MSIVTLGCPLCDARLPHGTCLPATQVVAPPSIGVVVSEPDWTPEACANEEALRRAILIAIRRKLLASNDLRDLRARDAEVRFEYSTVERWDAPSSKRIQRLACIVSLAWTVGFCCEAPKEHPIHTPPPEGMEDLPYHPYERHRAAAIGRAELMPMVPPWQTWWEAGRDALRKLGV